MRFPCEYVASTFLPSLRIRIAHRLRARGFSQNEIAHYLGVKQPVIVSYLQKKIIDTGDKKINHHLDDLSESISNKIYAQEEMDVIMRTICTKCKSLRINGPLCSIHKNILPLLAEYKDCDICRGFDKLPSLKERSIILLELKEVFSELERTRSFFEWVPEIGAQLATCDAKAKDLDDIASFPGRIIKVKDTITVVSPPEFGSSKTMSSLLLWIREIQNKTKWILSIKNKTELVENLKKQNIPFESTNELDIRWDENLDELSNKEDINKTRLILDSGSPGYESIAYVFAENKEDLLELLRDIDVL